METIIHKEIKEKISQLPDFLMEELSEYIDFLLFKTNKELPIESQLTQEEFQNWIKEAEKGKGMSLDEFETKWKNKEKEILNRTN